MSRNVGEAPWVAEILRYWFEELTPEDWFTRKDQTDRTITTRFMPLYRSLREKVPPEAYGEPRTALAAIIVLDQFPRNMFRRRPEAFATDDIALDLARNAIDREFDSALDEQKRHFLYLPLMHSEALADQERCVSLFQALGDGDGVKYAIEHRDIIAKFGRFPHRNRALGREPRQEETDFLASHEGFGQ